MINIKTFLLLNSFVFSLTACISTTPSITYYQLNAIDTEHNVSSIRRAPKDLTVLINPIKFPEYLDHPQLIIRDSAYKLKILENHQWAEPLQNEFSRILIENINKKITPRRAVNFAELNGYPPDLHVSIEVLKFDVNTAQQALLSVKIAYWKDSDKEKITRISKAFTALATGNNYEQMIAAQSQVAAYFCDYLIETVLSNK